MDQRLKRPLKNLLDTGDQKGLESYLKNKKTSPQQLEMLVREICSEGLEDEGWLEIICSSVDPTRKVFKAMIDCNFPVGKLLLIAQKKLSPSYLMVASNTNGMNVSLRSLLENGTFKVAELNRALNNTARHTNYIGTWLMLQAGAKTSGITDETKESLRRRIREEGDDSDAVATYLLLFGELPLPSLKKQE